jgi:hypothetical protein
VLEHLSAGFFTFAALLSAFFHVLIVLLRTLFAASAACFGAGGADQVGEHALPCRDTGGRRAVIGAVQTRLQGGLVLFFTVGEQPGAVVRTGTTGALTLIAGFGTVLEGLGMMFVAGGLHFRPASRTQSQGRHHAQQSQSIASHGYTSKKDRGF